MDAAQALSLPRRAMHTRATAAEARGGPRRRPARAGAARQPGLHHRPGTAAAANPRRRDV